MTKGTAKLLGHVVIREIGDVADHAGHRQAVTRHRAMGMVMAVVEFWVLQDGAPGDLIEGDVLGREPGRRGNYHGMSHAIRESNGPLQGLHATQASAHHRRKRFNAQAVGQQSLGLDPILDRDHGEVAAVGLARRGVHTGRAGGAEAGAQVVHAHDKESIRVHGLAGAHHVVPPAKVRRILWAAASHMVRGV